MTSDSRAPSRRVIVAQFVGFAFKASALHCWVLVAVAIGLALFPLLAACCFQLSVDLLVRLARDGTSSVEGIVLMALGIVGCDLAVTALQSLNRYAEMRVRDDLSRYLNDLFVRKTRALPFPLFERSDTYDVIQRALESGDWRPLGIAQCVPQILCALIVLSVSLTLTLSLAWWITPLIVASAVPSLLVAARVADIRYSITSVRSPLARRLLYFRQLVADNHSTKEVRAFGAVPGLLERMTRILDTFTRDRVRTGRKRLALEVAAEMVRLAAIGAVVVFLFHATAAAALTIGALTFYTELTRKLSRNTATLFEAAAELREHALFLQPFSEFLRYAAEPASGRRLPPGALGRVEFQAVSFEYDGGDGFALQDVSFAVDPGECVAIVGRNGGGKTTLIKLLLGLYAPTSGRILVGGIDLEDLDKEDVRSRMAVMFQDFVQYAMTARENICMGSDSAPDPERYEDAKRRSGAAAVIAALPSGDEQMLTNKFQGGIELSRGQWQKIALARAYARGAALLILDEPTAHMDAVSQAEFAKQLRCRPADSATIVTSHNLDSASAATRAIVLKRGRVVQAGTHSELSSPTSTVRKSLRSFSGHAPR